MKAIIIMSNEERKKIQIINNIKNPADLKAYFAISLECDSEDIKIELEGKQIIPKKTLEAELTAKDIRKLKATGIFKRQIFVTGLILKYKPQSYKKKEKK